MPFTALHIQGRQQPCMLTTALPVQHVTHAMPAFQQPQVHAIFE
ncbi:hypothetical protein FLA_1912 [Filimonas lacunae]|nr:hypothetical protein FLA_1912 [Filimonas lacunae]